MAGDFSATTSTSGRVTVGGTANGDIETAGDRDWFAVDLVAGRTYTIDLRGRPTADGTLSDPYLRGIHDAGGNLMAGTANDDGGDGYNSRVTFTATASGTYYIAAGAWGGNRGTYEVEVTDSSPAGTASHPDPTPTPGSDSPPDATPADADAARAGATDLGDITALQGPRFPRGTVDGSADQVDYYRFTLTEAKRVGLGLRQQDTDADLYLEDADGNVLYRSTTSGTGNERIAQTLLAGTYYLRVESQEAGLNAHVVRYGVSAPDPDAVAALEQASGTAPNEAPTFVESSYAFDLAENADGSTNRVSLGTVAATDPEGATLSYRLVGDSSSFEVDETSGELFYKGSGEDFESATTQFTLTVRASDGSETTDTTVTVNVTDVEETVDPPPTDGEQTSPQTVSEPDGEDFSADTSTSGKVAVGETATGDIGSDGDRDWFAVELVAGRTYTIDLRGRPTGDGTLSDPRLYGIHDADGNLIARTTNDDWGGTYNSRVTFTATETETGTFYIAAGAYGSNRGTYEVEVADTTPSQNADDTRTGATDFGDLTALAGPRFLHRTVDGDADEVDYYRFTLTEAKRVGLGLRRQDADANLYLEDADGNVLYSSTNSGTGNEKIEQTLLAGTYYVRVESQAAGVNEHVVRYGVSAPDADELAALQEPSGTAVNAAPSFGQPGYTFALAENTDGSTNRMSLGTVAATDPEGVTLAYRLAGGNESGSFEIDATSGELFYKGSGEDFESGTTQFTLTVQASDGSESAETTVTVDITDVDDTPAIRAADAEATEGDDTEMVFRVTLQSASTVTVTVNYATTDGTATAGEDYTATSGTLTFAPGETEKTVSVTIIDDTVEDSGETFRLLLSEPSGGSLGDMEATGTIFNSDPTSVSEPTGGDLPAGTTTTGVVAEGGLATGAIGTVGDQDWFAITLEAGIRYRIDLRGDFGPAPYGNAGTVKFPMNIRGIYDSGGNLIDGTASGQGSWDTRTYFTPTVDGTYYVAVEAKNNYDPRTGTYRVELTALEADQTAGTDTNGEVTVGGTATGEIGPAGDRDWFAVELVAGTSYRIELLSGSGWPDTYLHGIFDSDGDFIEGTANADGLGASDNALLYFTPDADGTYYISAGAERNDTGGYTVAVTAAERPVLVNDDDDYSADTGTTGTVAVDGTMMGNIEVWGDHDWFKVDLVAGNTYQIDMKGAISESGTLKLPVLFGIHDPRGTLIQGTDDDYTLLVDQARRIQDDSRVWFTASETGTHYIAASAWCNASVGTYELSVADVSHDDFAADATTMGTIAVGGSEQGEIEKAHDVDWFAVTLVGGTRYRIEQKGSKGPLETSNDGTLRDPYFQGVFDAAGNRFAGTLNDDQPGQGWNSRAWFTPESDGTYYVAAGAYATEYTQYIGTYTITIDAL